MRLRNLFEALGEEVAIIFGRFNPPHKGHRAAWELASRSPIWFVGTNKSTQGPKDPLPFDVKVEAMKTIWPEVEGHIVAETSWLTLASRVYKQYPNATLLCLTDEDWVTKTIVQYNGKEGAHGFYNFKKIEQKPTPRLSSATALRDAVSKGDRDAFTQAAGVDADTPVAGKPFFDLVAEYLLPYANAPKKAPAKKKKEPAVAEASMGSLMAANKIRQDKERLSKPTSAKVDNSKAQARDAAWWKAQDDAYKAGKDTFEFGGKTYPLKGKGVAEDKDPCWKGYKQIGMKKKGGKQVPNCVPKESVEEGVEDQEYIQQIAQEFIRRAKLGRHNADEGTIMRMLSKFFDKFGINDGYFDEAYHKVMNLVGSDQPTEDAAGVGIITKQNTTTDVNKGTLSKMMKAYHLTDSIAIDEGILSTDVAHALKRYGEHVKSNIFVELSKLFSSVKYDQALRTIATLDPAQKKTALKIIARAGGLLGQKLANAAEETYEGNEFYEAYGKLEETLEEAEYQGRSVTLNKPMRGDVKKFKVFVKDPSTGNVKKVNFGDPDMKIKAYDPDRRRSFRARHNCDNPGPKTKARYWSCRKW